MMNDETTTVTTNILSLTFSNYTDLQTRLLLFPLNDEESKGAVISSYTYPNDGDDDSNDYNDHDDTKQQPSQSRTSPKNDSKQHDQKEGDQADILNTNEKEEKEEDGKQFLGQLNNDEKNNISVMEKTQEKDESACQKSSHYESEEGPDEGISNHEIDSEKVVNANEGETKGVETTNKSMEQESTLEELNVCISDDNNDIAEEKKSDQDPADHGENVALKTFEEDTLKPFDTESPKKLFPQSPSSSSAHTKNLEGYILAGIKNITDLDDWKTCEFSKILAYCRNVPTPIVMMFEPPPTMKSEQDDHDERQVNKTTSTNEENVSADTANPADNTTTSAPANEISQRFSRWSSRVRTTTSLLAAETASRVQYVADSAADAAVKAKGNAAKAAEAAKRRTASLDFKREASQGHNKNHNDDNNDISTTDDEIVCSLFTQSSNGTLVEIPNNLSSVSNNNARKKTASVVITNSSLILCRQSIDSPLARSYTCKWYRLKPASNDSSADANFSMHSTSNQKSTSSWIPILDATFSAFQPSCTEIGYRIKCVIYVDSTSVYSCEIEDVVRADPSLFNAARQNVGEMGSGRGAIFSNLKGRGNASGRTFTAKIEITNNTSGNPNAKQKYTEIVTKLSLFQVSGSTAEPLHDHDKEPIHNPSTRSSCVDPKAFDLLFVPPRNSLLSALSQNNSLQLSAPNRISRESLLLSLGIANFRGKPSNLNSSTILFEENEEYNTIIDGEETEECYSSMIEDGGNSLGEKNGNIQEEESGNSNNETTESKSQSEINVLVNSLETDLMRMAKKLAAKDKVISELQRTLYTSDTAANAAQAELQKIKDHVNKVEAAHKTCQTNLKLAEKRQETHESVLIRVKGDFTAKISELEQHIVQNEEKTQEYEKIIKSLKNEKAVMSAAIEARDSKLLKMSDLQETITELKNEVEKGNIVRNNLSSITKDNEILQQQIKAKDEEIGEQLNDMTNAKEYIVSLESKLKSSEKHNSSINTKLLKIQSQNEKLKTERNKYKQKADSLSKEMSRICRNGLQISEIEKMIDNQESMQSEISILKAGKQQAMKELEHCRLDYGTLARAHQIAGGDYNTTKILEQRAELEKIVEDLTEYVQAKEMQIETMRDVNKSLMEEITSLRHFSM